MDHELFQFFNIFTWASVLGSDQDAVDFAVAVGLIPDKNAVMECVGCHSPMTVEICNSVKLGWRWSCPKRKRRMHLDCTKRINPATNTFFSNTTISIRESLAILFCFVLNLKVNFVFENLCSWRQQRNEQTISKHTVVDYYSFCREVCVIVNSNSSVVLGGAGKTIELDETFLTKRKYNRGRVIGTMSIIMFHIRCREDKESLFFEVASNSKREMWPYISKYCHKDTSRICTDGGSWYHDVNRLFTRATHSVTNHSKGEFVCFTDKTNTINSLENENKHFKSSLKSRRTPEVLAQYMAFHIYRRMNHFGDTDTSGRIDHGKNLRIFIDDVKRVYPGAGKDGMKLIVHEKPTAESENILHLMPKDTNVASVSSPTSAAGPSSPTSAPGPSSPTSAPGPSVIFSDSDDSWNPESFDDSD